MTKKILPKKKLREQEEAPKQTAIQKDISRLAIRLSNRFGANTKPEEKANLNFALGLLNIAMLVPTVTMARRLLERARTISRL
jgi:hypothetical protein